MQRVCVGIIALLFTLGSTAAENALSPDRALFQTPDVKVTVEDIDRYIEENLPLDAGDRAKVLSKHGAYREMAETLFVVRALAQEAESQPGFDEEQARWAAEMAYQRKLVKAYRRDYVRKATIDIDWELAAREAYNAEASKYMSPEMVQASHILIKTLERTDEEAQFVIQEIQEKLSAGSEFAELAREYSEDGAASSGGSLGYFSRGKMVAAFEEAAFALEEIGSISEPVKTRFGYHLIRLDGRRAEGPIPFEQVKSKIIPQIRGNMWNQLWQDKLIELRSSPDIKIDAEILTALENRSESTQE